MAQRIRHLTTNQGIPGSNPGRVVFYFFLLLHEVTAHHEVREQIRRQLSPSFFLHLLTKQRISRENMSGEKLPYKVGELVD